MLPTRGARACALAAMIAGCESDPGGESATIGATTGATTGADDTTAATTGAEASSTGMSEGAWSIGLELGADKGALYSVWGPAPDEVYAVGGQGVGADSTGVMLRWDGTTWTEVALPAGTRRLHWVAGVGDALWVVGEAGTSLRRVGEAWSEVATGTDVPLWGIWGASDSAIWAVGGDGFVGAPALLKYDGAAWSPEAVPPLPPESHALFKVWGSGAGDVTAVGDFGVALHHDGAAWTATETGSIADLISVSGRGAEHVAVGGRANARVARWDGSAWAGATLDRPGLSGVWVDDVGVATAVGSSGQILRITPGALEATEEESPTFLVLHAVFGFGKGPRFAVGGNLTGQPPYIGVIVQHPG